MTVKWSAPAVADLTQYLDHLHESDPRIAKIARDGIKRRTQKLGPHPFTGRPARWPNLRELSLTRWRKIVVYRVDRDEVVIVALYDARQDLRKVKPE